MKPLRAFVTHERTSIHPDLMPKVVRHFSIPALDEGGAPEVTEREGIDSHKLALAGGELLVSRLNPRKPRAHLVPTELDAFSVASTEFVALRPRLIDPRYARYLLLSEGVRQELDSQVRSATRSHQRVEPSAILALSVPIEDSAGQVRVADFLDDRVARIDRIIAARSEQKSLIGRALAAEYRDALQGLPTVPVRRLVREIVVGIVIQPTRLYTDDSDGVPALRGLNVKAGFISTADLVKITPAGHAENRRSALMPGDVVVVRTGDAGTAAVVPRDAEGWNCIDILVARPGGSLSSEYLELALNAARLSADISSASSGSIQQHFGVEALSGLPIPAASPAQQASIVDRIRRARDDAASAAQSLVRSIDLLAEYKQSLITAAVTGELDVTTAGSGIPG